MIHVSLKSFAPAIVMLAMSTQAVWAEKMAIGVFQTKEPQERAFLAEMRATPLAKFTVKSSDKSQGTIQAVRTALGGKEFASLFIMIRTEKELTIIEATFTRYGGFMGGGSPEQWAKQLSDELKSQLADLTVDIKKK